MTKCLVDSDNGPNFAQEHVPGGHEPSIERWRPTAVVGDETKTAVGDGAEIFRRDLYAKADRFLSDYRRHGHLLRGDHLTSTKPGEPRAKNEKASKSWLSHCDDCAFRVWLLYGWSSAAQEVAALAAVLFAAAFTLGKATVANGGVWGVLLTCTFIGYQVAAKLRQREWFGELQGAALTVSGSKWLGSKEFGVRLYVPEGSLKAGGSTDPVDVRRESKPIVCDGEYLFVTRTVNFGPKGMTFPKPLILEFDAGKHDTLVYRKHDDDEWQKCPDADITVVYRGLSRYLRLRVHHFCAYGDGKPALIDSWSLLHKINRKVIVTKINNDQTMQLLCIVYPYKWVEKKWIEISATLGALGVEASATSKAELMAALSKDRELKRQVRTIGLQARFSIPTEQGNDVSLILARMLDSGVTVFAEMNIRVGTELRVDMSKLTNVLPYDTVEHGKQLLSRVRRTLLDQSD